MEPVWKNVNVDPTERDKFRYWGQVDGATKNAAEAMKQPEGWKRNRGWGVGCPVRFHPMPSRFVLGS